MSYFDLENLKKADPEMAQVFAKELERQETRLDLIASENYASLAVMEAMGSILTNKYAEGYPGNRYYGGCDNMDLAENLAISRAKQLFGADHVNVQAHSGSGANMAVYFSVLKPGDTILSMNLSEGGHLSHGSPVSFSGQLYKIIPYGVDRETEMIDYDELEKLAKEHKPKMIVCGASAYSRIIDFKRFAEIAAGVDAYLLADIAHIAGLVVAGAHPSPIPHADFVTTTTHKTLRGPRGGMVMCKAEYAKAVDKSVFPGIQGGPLMNNIAAKAVAFKEALSDKFKKDQIQTVKNAKVVSDTLTEKGFRIVSGGTDNHLMLIDLTSYNITGKDAEAACAKSGIVLNMNTIPFDKQKAFIASGIRVGTPAATTRGMKEPEMKVVADVISRAVKNAGNDAELEKIRLDVKALCEKFPVYK
ncbi:serine hydroxymethyltransferase [Methanolapillus millepedarum]|uniref:Serine hydroxymethyltransferase n=1 Tax=Methanolapillus millepedarum TaxID=3028296 RepID=A0AA96V4D5_9EURY|nr:Serine hydroxymethyltransferase [Methanosarcinaceae archaeon Ac7]